MSTQCSHPVDDPNTRFQVSEAMSVVRKNEPSYRTESPMQDKEPSHSVNQPMSQTQTDEYVAIVREYFCRELESLLYLYFGKENALQVSLDAEARLRAQKRMLEKEKESLLVYIDNLQSKSRADCNQCKDAYAENVTLCVELEQMKCQMSDMEEDISMLSESQAYLVGNELRTKISSPIILYDAATRLREETAINQSCAVSSKNFEQSFCPEVDGFCKKTQSASNAMTRLLLLSMNDTDIYDGKSALTSEDFSSTSCSTTKSSNADDSFSSIHHVISGNSHGIYSCATSPSSFKSEVESFQMGIFDTRIPSPVASKSSIVSAFSRIDMNETFVDFLKNDLGKLYQTQFMESNLLLLQARYLRKQKLCQSYARSLRDYETEMDELKWQNTALSDRLSKRERNIF